MIGKVNIMIIKFPLDITFHIILNTTEVINYKNLQILHRGNSDGGWWRGLNVGLKIALTSDTVHSNGRLSRTPLRRQTYY